MTKRPFNCAWCKKPSTYTPDDDNEATPDNLICDQCFKDEEASQERDEQYAKYHHEQQRIRYEGVSQFDNEVGKISVVYHRKVLRTWNYKFIDIIDEAARRRAKIEAESYIEGWCDAIAAIKKSKMI